MSESLTKEEKLKPVTFCSYQRSFHSNNVFQQNLLLKALQVTINPYKLKEMVGFKNTAEVFRTLDKLAIRKEYHTALAKHGVDLSSIVLGIKDICENGEKDGDRLRGYQILLKSLGLDEYKHEDEGSSKTWEDALKEYVEDEDKSKLLESGDYNVIEPEVPKEEIESIENEKRIGQSIYE